MRSGTDRRPDLVADTVADWPAIDTDAAESADDTEPEASERITLIEFTWVGLTGRQPVIYVSREWLQ